MSATAAPSPAPASALMTKSEREDLRRLITQREKVLKQVARARSAELLADFERQMAAIYTYDQDKVWNEATRQASSVVADAQRAIAERCKELGIPAQFAPSISFSWHDRGENASKERRAELRRVAEARIKAIEEHAFVRIAQSDQAGCRA